MTDFLSCHEENFQRKNSCSLDDYPEYKESAPNILNAKLKHSKSDDLVLQSSSAESSLQENKLNLLPLNHSLQEKCFTMEKRPKSIYLSDSEPDINNAPVNNVSENKSKMKYNSMISHRVGLYDNVDPEDSIRDIITENDFYRFVLFKSHYDKYLRLSLKYEEARNIAYYLEEKYHEIKTERDSLLETRKELVRKLETKDLELHEKEEELFLQLEKVVRLEEDCEKLRAEKEKFAHWKDKLEKERNEAYAQLKLQTQEAETTRRGLEQARQEIIHQVTVISAEKDFLERENEELKERLEVERAGAGHYLMDLSLQKKKISENVIGLEKEVSELKLAATQSATLNSQLKKAMKHLASCKRKKCSVCAYTKASFGEYAGRNDKKLFACLQVPFQDLRNWMRPMPPGQLENFLQSPQSYNGKNINACPEIIQQNSPCHSFRSDYSFRRTYSLNQKNNCVSSPSPSSSLPLSYPVSSHISYIDETSTVSESSSDSGHDEEFFTVLPCPAENSFNASACTCACGPDMSLTSTTSVPPGNRAFSSDSGFSSELYDSKQPTLVSANLNNKGKFERSKWSASFRKLIKRVSKRSVFVSDKT